MLPGAWITKACATLPVVLLVSVVQIRTPAHQYTPPPAPEQPLPYSHKDHLKLGLGCATCHTMPEPGDAATIPPTGKCMECHAHVETDSLAIQQLAAAHEKGELIEWQRVYRVPSFVFFSHKQHVIDAVMPCETCHGAVREMEITQKVKDTSMPACMACHEERGAPNTCDTCHDPR